MQKEKKRCRIAFFGIKEWEKDYISNNLKDFDILLFQDELSLDNAQKAKDSEIISVFIYSKIDKKILDMLPKLKFIATRSTGYDHIDIEECAKRKIVVSNVPYYGENTVAEHTFALILSLSRKIHKSYERTVRGDFSIEGLQGFDLRGRTIGVIGTGHIGMHVIRMAKGFEMKGLAYDKFPDEKTAKRIGFKYTGFDYLLGNSDIITLHAPYSKETHHLINKKNIAKVKKGAILINTARGGLVETEALTFALVKGILGGAGLDVLEEETAIKQEEELLSARFSNEELKTMLRNHILLKLDNVIITPHNAFNSREALQRILDTTIDNAKGFMKGKIINKVSK